MLQTSNPANVNVESGNSLLSRDGLLSDSFDRVFENEVSFQVFGHIADVGMVIATAYVTDRK